jgi:molybdate transport system substrate-binding protein
VSGRVARACRYAAGGMGVLALLLLASGGCGGSARPRLSVSAAASLRRAFTAYAHDFSSAEIRLSFAGSDALAAQIEQGIRPDVFASANTQLPDRLFAEGLAERPVVFAANRLVLAVPASSRIAGLADAERAGVSVATGSASVPIGAYTAAVIARLPAVAQRALLANVRDREPDVSGIVGKLFEGAVDAGFVYATDVDAAGGRLRAIPLPEAVQPQVAYGAAVVKGSAHLAQARAFVAGLLSPAGRRQLLGSGFLPPP